MLAEAYRALVAIGRDVPDGEERHDDYDGWDFGSSETLQPGDVE